VVKGKQQIGLILPQIKNDEDAILLEPALKFLEDNVGSCIALTLDKKKSDGYLRRKFRKLIDLAAKNLPDYITNAIIGDIEAKSSAQLKENIISLLMIETGFSVPAVTIINGRGVVIQVRKRTRDMEDDEFATCYARVRDCLFSYCQDDYSQKVNGKYQIFEGYTDLQMFEAFGCLYLGLQMKEMELVENEMDNLDETQTIKYLQMVKLMGYITAEMFLNKYQNEKS